MSSSKTDHLALPRVVKSDAAKYAKEDMDVDAQIKKLIRGHQKNKHHTKTSSSSSTAAKNNAASVPQEPPLKQQCRDVTNHVLFPRMKQEWGMNYRMTFRCHGCGELCRDTCPWIYPLSRPLPSVYRGRDLFGHAACLYRFNDQRRNVYGDNGLVTIMLRDTQAKFELIDSAFILKTLPVRKTQDTFI